MPKKKELIDKLYRKPKPKNFTIREMEQLLSKCNCKKFEGGRGSGVGYYHTKTKRILQFDLPHPGKELYNYHIDKLKEFIELIDEKE
jgi:hypothetical protein